jgi:TPR repeat protein
MAAAADFTIAGLLTDTGVSRAQFRRCFAGKSQLLAALTQDGAKALGEILKVAQPVEILQAVGSDVTPAAPIADAWLERRLRVFERALAGLEKRQEKSEQSLGQRLALMEEKLAAGIAAPAEPAAFDSPESHLLPSEPSRAKVTPPDLAQPEFSQSEIAPADPAPADLAPKVLAHVEEIAGEPLAGDPGAEPVSEKDMADFIAHARRLAQSAVPPPQKVRRRRGMAWNGMVLAFILMGGLMLIGVALLLASGVPQAAPAAAIRHRQVAKNDFARLIALADSGNADAETMLALTYLHGPAVNEQAARRWSIAAALQGQPVAQYLLGTLYLENNASDAVRWLSAAAEQGNVKAMHNLAIAYAQGLGVTPDPAIAVQWFTRAATQGCRDSEFDLAVLYERGQGVPQSGAEALKWYLIAAGRGDAPSVSRAAFLKDQLGPDDVRMATAEAAGFVPLPDKRAANQIPEF